MGGDVAISERFDVHQALGGTGGGHGDIVECRRAFRHGVMSYLVVFRTHVRRCG